jgi:prepilin-type N-terminal cleavage/methylation domain-containing protein
MSSQRGFTLLECMIALLLLATSAMILVQAQTAAVNMQEDASRLGVATMLARQLMTDLELFMEKEGFGELEVKETGDFSDEAFDDQFDDYRWEYEVEKVDLEIPNLGNLMNMMGGGGEDEEGGGAGLGGGAGGGGNQMEALSSLGVDFSFMSELLANYLREARVRVCWKIRIAEPFDRDNEDCLEFITHLTNPTGQITAGGDDDDDDAAP